jgi:hypothetical protein
MNLPTEVTDILNIFLVGVQDALKDNLVGIYLRGSLALGDFDPETSDLDLLAVTEQPVAEAEFAALASLHAQIGTLPNPYANELEITYLDRAALRRFQPGLSHPTLGRGETLIRSEHHTNWLLERWAVRERGVTLLGPEPQALIDPIAAEELYQAVRLRLNDWADWARTLGEPDWQVPRKHQAYPVETMCRVLYMLTNRELSSKPQAVAWALQILPEPWRATVERSQTWRTDDTIDPSIGPEVRDFILGVAASTIGDFPR